MTLSLQLHKNLSQTPSLMLLMPRDESSSELNLPQIPLGCQAALSDADFLDGGSDSAQLLRLVVGELIHGALGHVGNVQGKLYY